MDWHWTIPDLFLLIFTLINSWRLGVRIRMLKKELADLRTDLTARRVW